MTLRNVASSAEFVFVANALSDSQLLCGTAIAISFNYPEDREGTENDMDRQKIRRYYVAIPRDLYSSDLIHLRNWLRRTTPKMTRNPRLCYCQLYSAHVNIFIPNDYLYHIVHH
ncbi:hypothetical protein WG66_003851 [Moniliophthora roreri]|nr:hypothetical protein WG66_003851 [Moniliophthora roreri]